MLETEDDSAIPVASSSSNDLISASQSTLATEAPLESAQKNERTPPEKQENDEDSKGPLNEESSSNVLFHPPAAHEELSADSCNENEDVTVGTSSLVATNLPDPEPKKADQP